MWVCSWHLPLFPSLVLPATPGRISTCSPANSASYPRVAIFPSSTGKSQLPTRKVALPTPSLDARMPPCSTLLHFPVGQNDPFPFFGVLFTCVFSNMSQFLLAFVGLVCKTKHLERPPPDKYVQPRGSRHSACGEQAGQDLVWQKHLRSGRYYVIVAWI